MKPRLEGHIEQIRCANCAQEQTAAVLYTRPWWTYNHECTECGYVTTESEWDKIKTE